MILDFGFNQISDFGFSISDLSIFRMSDFRFRISFFSPITDYRPDLTKQIRDRIPAFAR